MDIPYKHCLDIFRTKKLSFSQCVFGTALRALFVVTFACAGKRELERSDSVLFGYFTPNKKNNSYNRTRGVKKASRSRACEVKKNHTNREARA